MCLFVQWVICSAILFLTSRWGVEVDAEFIALHSPWFCNTIKLGSKAAHLKRWRCTFEYATVTRCGTTKSSLAPFSSWAPTLEFGAANL